MKFRYIHKVDAPVNTYDGLMVSTGDIIELDGWLAGKAKKDPHYEVVTESTVIEPVTAKSKKK